MHKHWDLNLGKDEKGGDEPEKTIHPLTERSSPKGLSIVTRPLDPGSENIIF